MIMSPSLFRPLELVARVKSQLRRYKRYNPAQSRTEERNVIFHSDLEMDIKAHKCMAAGTPVTLTPTEFSILRILLENKGSVVSAEELFHQIWQDEYYTKIEQHDNRAHSPPAGKAERHVG